MYNLYYVQMFRTLSIFLEIRYGLRFHFYLMKRLYLPDTNQN